MQQGKVWGQTQTVYRSPVHHVEKLVIAPHSECSWHYHRVRWNDFRVASGQLIIEVDRSLTYGQRARGTGYALIERTILNPGDYTAVPPGVTHRFVTEADGCVGWEDYWVEDASNDIVRSGVGRTRKGEE